MTLYQGSQARRSDPCKKRSQVGSCKLTIATALVCCVSVRVYVCVCVCVCVFFRHFMKVFVLFGRKAGKRRSCWDAL